MLKIRRHKGPLDFVVKRSEKVACFYFDLLRFGVFIEILMKYFSKQFIKEFRVLYFLQLEIT